MVRSVKLRVVGCPYGDSRDDRVTAVDGQAPDWAWERRRSGMRGGRWRVKGERDAGTAAGLAKRCWLASAAGSGTASRRRGRRSGPLTRLMGEYPGRQGSAVVAADRGRVPGGGEHSLPASHPTAEPCLPARAGVRGLAPGAGLRPGVRSRVAHPAARGLEVGLHGGGRVEQGEVHARLEIHLRVRERVEPGIGGRDVAGEVLATDLAGGVAVLGGEQAWPVEVQERRQGALRETVDVGGEALRDVVVTEPPAHDAGVLALDEGVVVGGAGAGLGEPLDAELFEQFGDAVVDVLAAVVRVEAEDAERERQQQAFEQRQKEALRDAGHGADELVLGDLVHQVDEVEALDAVAVPLVDGVHAHVSRPALGLRGLAQADGHGHRLRPRPHGALRAVRSGAAQVVDVAVGDRREALEARVPEHLELAPQDLARGQPRHLPVGLVDVRQQPDVDRRVPSRERPAAAAAAPVPDRPGLAPLPYQALRLLERYARRGDEELENHPLVVLAEMPVAEALQRVPDEAVGLFAVPRLEVHRLVAFDEGAKLPDCA